MGKEQKKGVIPSAPGQLMWLNATIGDQHTHCGNPGEVNYTGQNITVLELPVLADSHICI